MLHINSISIKLREKEKRKKEKGKLVGKVEVKFLIFISSIIMYVKNHEASTQKPHEILRNTFNIVLYMCKTCIVKTTKIKEHPNRDTVFRADQSIWLRGSFSTN